MTSTEPIVFKQGKVRPKTINRTKIKKSLKEEEDATVFFMLADAMCSNRKIDCIEKFNVDVFKNQKIASPVIPEGLIDTIEVMLDPDMMSQIRAGEAEHKQGKTISWKKVKISA